MNIESFVVGILTVVVVVTAIAAVSGLLKAFKLSAELNNIKQRLTDDERELSREINMVEQTLRNGLTHECDQLHRRIDDAYRHTDQRVDKLDAKLTGTLKSSKEVLKG
jgi:gas vesicle protein